MRRHVIAVLAGLLVLTACGARLTDEQRAAMVSSDQDPNQSGVVSPNSRTSSTTTTVADGNRTTTSAGGGGDQTQSGDGGSGEGDQGVVIGAGSTCGGGGESDVGVTEAEIKLGNISTLTGPIRNFGQTGINGAKAYINYVNATGGVCGRELGLVIADDRLQSGTNKAKADELKDQVLGFVGSTTVVDDGTAQSLGGTDIAYTGLAISESMIRSPNNFPVTPINLDQGGNNAQEAFDYFKDTEGVARGGIVWPAQAAAKARAAGYREDMERAGIEVVMETEVAVTETNYTGVAQNVENAEVDVLITTLEITGMSNLARDLQTVGYFPTVPFYGAQAYGRDFLARTGDAAEPTVLALAFSLFEDRGSVRAVDDFLTWYERTNPGADIDFFSIQSWVATDLYVKALRSVDGPPTRAKVLAALQGIKEYDADGFIAPINPADKIGPSCFVVARVSGGSWYRAHPPSGFECAYG